MVFKEFLKRFPDDNAVIEYFIKTKYPQSVKCPHCGSVTVIHRKDYPKLFQCNTCNNSFSIFKDTIFEKTTTDLTKWFYVIYLFFNTKKGISAVQLQHEIGVTYKCAWRILHQIRKAMAEENPQGFYEAMIEIDFSVES
jgi:transposase-like protein